MKKILISTGGSGGHVIPSLIIFDHLKNNFETILVTDKRGTNFIDKNLYPFELIDVPKINNSIFLFPKFLILFIFSLIKSFFFLKKNKINILISTGGYMSLPLCIISKLFKIKIILFEPNIVLGRSNKVILKYAKKIICYHDKIINFPKNFYNKITVINNLMRKETYNFEKKKNKEKLDTIKILVLGGSQGAFFFDKMVKDVIIKIYRLSKINVYQQIFNLKNHKELENEYSKLNIEYEFFNYDKVLHKKLNTFDIAITRSGASALAELTFFNIPFIAIPFPYAKDNHQFYNAEFYNNKNSCWLVSQNNHCTDKIINIFKEVIENKKDYDIKKENLSKISYQNTWNNINKKLIDLINEN